jgi:uncharacterized cupin superfamily protein
MSVVVRWDEATWTAHPPYQDAGLNARLGQVFASGDGRVKAVYWDAQGPGRLLERPKGDELICVLKGEAVVEWHGTQTIARPGDVILWLRDDPATVFVTQTLRAFCVAWSD